MKLRQLKQKDAPLMLEWMHDKEIVCHLSSKFAEKTIEDCNAFILESLKKDVDIHKAIVNDQDEYLGTVSLKHINDKNKTAEFAITVRNHIRGTGISKQAMETILQMGLHEFKLEEIYWCVSCENVRAVRFYEKNGYRRSDLVPETIMKEYSEESLNKFFWYVYNKNYFN